MTFVVALRTKAGHQTPLRLKGPYTI